MGLHAGVEDALVPALVPILVRGRIRGEHESWLVRRVIEIYRPVLAFLIEHPWPILWLTGLIFILGVTPLVFSTGAGAGARHSAGTGVMGGMLAATFLAIFFIPWFYKTIVDRKLSDTRSTAEIEGEVQHHREVAKRAARTPHHHPLGHGGDDAL